MSGEAELEMLRTEGSEARRRAARGIAELAFTGAAWFAAFAWIGPLTMIGGVLLVFGGLIALLVGLTDIVEGSVRAVLSARDVRQLTRLPAARVHRLP